MYKLTGLVFVKKPEIKIKGRNISLKLKVTTNNVYLFQQSLFDSYSFSSPSLHIAYLKFSSLTWFNIFLNPCSDHYISSLVKCYHKLHIGYLEFMSQQFRFLSQKSQLQYLHLIMSQHLLKRIYVSNHIDYEVLLPWLT